jgi:hypothetical protein
LNWLNCSQWAFVSRWVRSHPRFAGTVLGHGLLHKQFANGAQIILLWDTP